MQTFYRELSSYFKDIVNFHVETTEEVKSLKRIFKRYEVKLILDIACGVGRHTVPLAKEGYTVTGLDFSKWQLKEAKIYALKEGVSPSFVLKNANDFNFKNLFDAAICMWTTLGEEPMVYQNVIENTFNSLKDGGIFIIENNDWSEIPKSKEKLTTRKKDFNGTTIEEYIHDRFTEHFRIRDVVMTVNAKKYQDVCITFTKKPREWKIELLNAGFKKVSIIRNYKKKKNSVLIVGQK